MTPAPTAALGAELVDRLRLDDVWLVDPVAEIEGRADLEVREGRIASVTRQDGPRRRDDLLVVPGLCDLHAHLREPGDGAAETIATGLAAAAHGGFTTVAAMANTEPPLDRADLVASVLRSGEASGPVRMLTYGTTTAGRAGAELAPLAALAAAGAVGFSDDGSSVSDPQLLRAALTEAGALGRVVVEHPEDAALAADAEANEGLPATILGLRGCPAAAEESAVSRALAILAQVVREAPPGCRPRLHLTHVSTGAGVALVREAKARGLPVTCDVTPHHLALHDGWLGGDRRFAWDAAEDPWAGQPATGPAYDTSTRVNPPLRSPDDALTLAAAVADGTVDAIATDHAPHRWVDKAVAFGDAKPGISGIETALGLMLAAVDAGVLPLPAAIRALAAGPRRVLHLPPPALDAGSPADLVVIERTPASVSETWLRSGGKNTPLVGMTLPARVVMTIARGRLAYEEPERAPASARR